LKDRKGKKRKYVVAPPARAPTPLPNKLLHTFMPILASTML